MAGKVVTSVELLNAKAELGAAEKEADRADALLEEARAKYISLLKRASGKTVKAHLLELSE